MYPTFFSQGSPRVGGITKNHQCGFRRNRSTTGQIEERHKNTMVQPFTNTKKAYESGDKYCMLLIRSFSATVSTVSFIAMIMSVTDLPFMFLFRLFVGRQWTSCVHEIWLIRVAPASRTRRLYTQVSVTAGLTMTQWTLELTTQL
jgi:hypothetical protein